MSETRVRTKKGQSCCVICRREYHRRYREEHPEMFRRSAEKSQEARLKHRYGISSEQYAELLVKQGNKCAICSRHFGEKETFWPVIDHDHKTGKVRGILCNTCNSGLGLLQDDIMLLKIALDYLNACV